MKICNPKEPQPQDKSPTLPTFRVRTEKNSLWVFFFNFYFEAMDDKDWRRGVLGRRYRRLEMRQETERFLSKAPLHDS